MLFNTAQKFINQMLINNYITQYIRFNIAVLIVKKLIGIFLLLLFLFNLVGYRIVFSYINTVLDKQAEASFDNNKYDENATVTIKVPLYLPYQAERSAFERADGKVNINGKVYRYIKRKIINNEMILVCVADNEATKLNKNQSDFLKTTTGLFDNNSSKKADAASIGFFKLLTLYNNHTVTYNFSIAETLKAEKIISSDSNLMTCSKEPPTQPPDFI